ncbi:MAG: hypothetical protein ACI9GB_003474 [Halioglobus sp.]|jgi:hypothetical protein
MAAIEKNLEMGDLALFSFLRDGLRHRGCAPSPSRLI